MSLIGQVISARSLLAEFPARTLALESLSVGSAQEAPKFLRYPSGKESNELETWSFRATLLMPLVNMGDTPSSGPSELLSDAKRRLGTQKACDTCRSRKVKVRWLGRRTSVVIAADIRRSARLSAAPQIVKGASSWGWPVHGTGQGAREAAPTGELPHIIKPLVGCPGRTQKRTICLNISISSHIPDNGLDHRQLGRGVLEPKQHPSGPATSKLQQPPSLHPESRSRARPHATHILSDLGQDCLARQAIDDWFQSIHPLIPVLHRRRFLSRLQDGEMDNNPAFLAMVISIVAVTSASLSHKGVPVHDTVLPLRCARLINEYDLLNPDTCTIDWCVAHYNLAWALVCHLGLPDWRVFRTIKSCMTGVQWFLLYNREKSGYDTEIAKRLYSLLISWDMYVLGLSVFC